MALIQEHFHVHKHKGLIRVVSIGPDHYRELEVDGVFLSMAGIGLLKHVERRLIEQGLEGVISPFGYPDLEYYLDFSY